ncbi:MAG: sugar ABC transporter ATP-binding protein [Sedimentisphaerales bacterium]|nr:sugar ABC transporter ATP-binding protein [Sedimentisphaerales bacterium]
MFKACGIHKSYPGVKALSDLDLDLRAGEVHALVGENGAGKSTLARIMGGIDTPDSGQMHLNELPYHPQNRAQAESSGVRMVMQELNLIGNLSVAENIFFDHLPNRFGIVNTNRLNQDARQIMQRVGLGDIDPGIKVRDLGIGQQQMVEIAAGLSQRCRIMILDEPTASLTDKETALLFDQIKKLQTERVGIVYISHRIEEIITISDRITVLRDGKLVATRPTGAVTSSDIIRMMVGRDLSAETCKRQRKPGQVALRVKGLSHRDKVKNVSFEVHRGEILGFAGLMGSGRTETMRALFGADRADEGKIYLYGADTPARIRTPRDAVRAGMAFITEDRKEQGLLPALPVRMNITLGRLGRISRLGLIDAARERAIADEYIDLLSIRCRSCEQPVRQLSGGNQQKVVISKWLHKDCDILIFDEPTRGIDVGAKFEIYQLLGELADKGKAIIVISSDVKELMAVCDHIAVISAGRLVAQFSGQEWTPEKIASAAFSEYIKNPTQGHQPNEA